mmetsp:Transcript_63372/g.145772  ORF Transcript_63372/g.145772 Transcript_63372/m.145772 type:complete len:210 (-) Transcript_63372:520-1149(-)
MGRRLASSVVGNSILARARGALSLQLGLSLGLALLHFAVHLPLTWVPVRRSVLLALLLLLSHPSPSEEGLSSTGTGHDSVTDQLVDMPLDVALGQNIRGPGAILRLLLQQALHEITERRTVLVGDGLGLRRNDLHYQAGDRLALEGIPQGTKLIEDHPHGPDISLVAVRLVVAHLRGQVQWGPDDRLSLSRRRPQALGNPEIPDFHNTL